MGGISEMVMLQGIKMYFPTINRGVTSVEYDGWVRSFSVSKPISMHIELSIEFANKDVVMFTEMNTSLVL